MKTSLNIASIAGIPIKIHWSFGLIGLLIGFLTYKEGLNTREVLYLILGFVSVFSCVLLHELGHALVAKKFNIQARDILLTPIGGLARLKSKLIKPREEILIAFAGPFMNFCLACLFFLIIFFSGNLELINIQNIGVASDIKDFVGLLFFINAILFLFNLIPAFPMDGGRIFRAVLNLKFSRTTSTLVASLTGKFFALIFVFLGVKHNYYALIIVGAVVYLLAEQESRQELNEISNTIVD